MLLTKTLATDELAKERYVYIYILTLHVPRRAFVKITCTQQNISVVINKCVCVCVCVRNSVYVSLIDQVVKTCVSVSMLYLVSDWKAQLCRLT